MRPRADRTRRFSLPLQRDAEEMRLRYQYHDLVLRGKVRVSLETAKRLVDPDRAYHLYDLVRLRSRRLP